MADFHLPSTFPTQPAEKKMRKTIALGVISAAFSWLLALGLIHMGDAIRFKLCLEGDVSSVDVSCSRMLLLSDISSLVLLLAAVVCPLLALMAAVLPRYHMRARKTLTLCLPVTPGLSAAMAVCVIHPHWSTFDWASFVAVTDFL
ncbi:hypothetical protein [Nonomuraea rhodomycinica]|uniref:Uncharacterized protein n=1 Tax=Nonomuraea rhodomycinica TaxID=1712872 RepID=A0A7Y6MCH6_9ACTN|nr:hypothetical protein [Nonomuraea rhodomycinica]NUW42797.1 hypothetical protein [Nonomuraea rhodomycinica]